MNRARATAGIFVVAGLLLALAVALVVSPFASSSPDGLERVAEDEGFADAAEDHDVSGSPFGDYETEGVEDERLSTGVAGVVGVLLTFGIGLTVFGALRVLRPVADEDRSSSDDRTPTGRSST